MVSKCVRKVVKIDEDRCNGCGLCVPGCAEGAIRIVDGKARLVADNLCDGLGACLGHCPQDAITVEERPAYEFDEHAVEKVRHAASTPHPQAGSLPVAMAQPPNGHAGCPGSQMRLLNQRAASSRAESSAPSSSSQPSRLTHWPVQLALVPVAGPIWKDTDVLICADCVPYAFSEFHEKLLTGPDGRPRSIAIACPKLDDVGAYVEKLAAIFKGNPIRSITVARMEVPCCGGIVAAVQMALRQADRQDIPVRVVTVGIDGTLR